MDDHIIMRDEWEAWRLVCVELTKASASLDINDEPRLHAALVYWGEALAKLRRSQPEADTERWRIEALDKVDGLTHLRA